MLYFHNTPNGVKMMDSEMLERYGAKRIASGWKMLCPVHPDKTPSLVVYDSGAVKCFTGCSARDVKKALGLKNTPTYRKPQLTSAWWRVEPFCQDEEWPRLVANVVRDMAKEMGFRPEILERLLADGMPNCQQAVILRARERLKQLSGTS
jgi:hypothetical protein